MFDMDYVEPTESDARPESRRERLVAMQDRVQELIERVDLVLWDDEINDDR